MTLTLEEYNNKQRKITEELQDFIMKSVQAQEALFKEHPDFGKCDCGDQHEELHADRGVLTEFLVFAAYTAFGENGEKCDGLALLQDYDRPKYAKLGLVEEVNREYL